MPGNPRDHQNNFAREHKLLFSKRPRNSNFGVCGDVINSQFEFEQTFFHPFIGESLVKIAKDLLKL